MKKNLVIGIIAGVIVLLTIVAIVVAVILINRKKPPLPPSPTPSPSPSPTQVIYDDKDNSVFTFDKPTIYYSRGGGELSKVTINKGVAPVGTDFTHYNQTGGTVVILSGDGVKFTGKTALYKNVPAVITQDGNVASITVALDDDNGMVLNVTSIEQHA